MLVNVTEGTLKGEKLKNALTSEEFYSFRGIPFAKPPVGPLRFKNPAPPEKYKGVWDATQERSKCLQREEFSDVVIGDEDCLYLNVYTPKLPEGGSALKPVMFFIYGGGFFQGYKDFSLHGPDFLVAKDVVLVIPNYRLGIFGFLNLGTEESPGNVGLKDQLAALKWTKQNIRQFGGDPDNITIFGESAGAESVFYFLYSPLTRAKGLFHKAIIQSALHKTSFDSAETSTERALRVAQKSGFGSKDSHELHNFLMKVPAVDLMRHSAEFSQEERAKGVISPFGPTMEVFGHQNERFIAVDGTEFLKQNPGVPIMDGLCSREAAFIIDGLLAGKPAEEFINRLESFIVPTLFKNLAMDEKTKNEVIDKFKHFYFDGKSTEEEMKLAIIDFFSDLTFNRGYYYAIKVFAQNSSQPIYSYLFSHPPTSAKAQYYKRPAFLKGAGHYDEMGYLFNMQFSKDKFPISKAERKITEFMTSIWTDFAKYGNPGKSLSVKLRPVTSNEKSYLEINEELIVKPGLIFEDRMKFIDSIYASLTM